MRVIKHIAMVAMSVVILMGWVPIRAALAEVSPLRERTIPHLVPARPTIARCARR